jgi:quinohemoprotein ethanol dehydrogenase
VLADVEMNGKPRKVLMQAPKNGFFYVLDRATGELLSAEKYTMANWASHIDLKSGKPVLTGQGWYKDEPKLVVPSLSGGHNWQQMSYNPNTGLVYIPEHTVPMVYEAASKTYTWKPDEEGTAINYNQLFNYQAVKQQVKQAEDTMQSESLVAWDPLTQKAVWKVSEGAPDGGTLSTQELVFQGTRTGYLKVYEAQTGKMLKEIFTGTGIMAAPTTYSIDGEQYVAVMAGYGGAPTCCYPADAAFYTYENRGRIIAFKVGGIATPLPPLRTAIKTPPPPDTPLKEELLAKGSTLYYTYCETCHGIVGKHYSLHPDLTKLPVAKHQLFNNIVLGGILAKNGMASFSNSLNEQDVEAIHQYLIKLQQDLYKKQELAIQ